MGPTRELQEDMEVDKIMRTLLTLGANSSTPRRHGSGEQNTNETPHYKIMSTLGANSSTPRRHGSGQNNENITNTRGKLEHSTKTWKWTK